MKLSPVLFSALCFAITAALAAPLSKPDCQEKCGNVTIPYPFGIGSQCSANSSFVVVCRNSTDPPTPVLSSISLQIINISMYGTVTVNSPVSPANCSDGLRTETLPLSLKVKGSPFTISSEYNSLAVMGCVNSVWLRANDMAVAGGCTAICDADSRNSSCNGINCCQIAIPARLRELQYTYRSVRGSSTNSTSSCGYVFPVDKEWLHNVDSERYNPFAPLVLEWEFETLSTMSSCTSPDLFRGSLSFDSNCYTLRYDRRCRSLIDEMDHVYSYSNYYLRAGDNYVSMAGYCLCYVGYEGNPYIVGGCTPSEVYGRNYGCVGCNGNNKRTRSVIVVFVTLGSVLGGLFSLALAWKFGKAVVEAIMTIKASRKYMFFKRNGGILLEQQLAMIENGIDKTRLFNSVELAKATDDYNENRVLGRGGEGVVYKGMLEDGRIVAVKKSERVSQGDVEDFINEVVIVSQINHRNVVKLIGCCLESEVPRLVYEFVPNGTLFSHIHHPHEDFPLFWEMRVRIARQVAGALAYLHSSASVPIYHRDIKSTNILLDEKYRAKISDFGTSRSISLDQTHVTTRVVGTFGYLDPEYFQSSQFTEKSDVYSFGVVLVELLTGEKAISAVRIEEGRGLAMHFLHSMEENQVLEIIDARVLREATTEEIMDMANIAKRCLHLNGKGRPTMKEVARDLDAIQAEKQESEFSQTRIESNGLNTIEDDDDDSDGFSSISEINFEES